MYAFDYHTSGQRRRRGRRCSPRSDDAKLLAGGQSLHADDEAAPGAARATWSTSAASPNCKGIKAEGGGVTIGAHDHGTPTSRHRRRVKRAIPALAELAGGIGDPQVRNRGTIGGSIANNDPAADYPAAVLALGATVQHQPAQDRGRRLLHRACSRPRSSAAR